MILLFLMALHFLTATSKSKSSRCGPSMLILSNWSRVVVLSLFRRGVFTLFIVEKARSQSAVLNGMVRFMQARHASVLVAELG